MSLVFFLSIHSCRMCTYLDPVSRVHSAPPTSMPVMSTTPDTPTASKIRVKLGLYVHCLVRTLAYNVFSVDHGHPQSENMYIFFQIRRTERCTKSDITYQFSLQEHFFALSLVFFSNHEHVIQPFSFNFNFPARFQVHDALKGNFTVRKANNEPHSGRGSIFRGRSLAWTHGTSPSGEENCLLDRSSFGYYLPFFISLEGT